MLHAVRSFSCTGGCCARRNNRSHTLELRLGVEAGEGWISGELGVFDDGRWGLKGVNYRIAITNKQVEIFSMRNISNKTRSNDLNACTICLSGRWRETDREVGQWGHATREFHQALVKMRNEATARAAQPKVKNGAADTQRLRFSLPRDFSYLCSSSGGKKHTLAGMIYAPPCPPLTWLKKESSFFFSTKSLSFNVVIATRAAAGRYLMHKIQAIKRF